MKKSKLINENSGFTLLEIIIVIIIIGVLAALALPRMFKTVEASRAAEAVSAISVIRRSVERCGLATFNDFTRCDTFNEIDIGDPAGSPNNHFIYAITSNAATPDTYYIVPSRNLTDPPPPPNNKVIAFGYGCSLGLNPTGTAVIPTCTAGTTAIFWAAAPPYTGVVLK